jgi:hypothetical protein
MPALILLIFSAQLGKLGYHVRLTRGVVEVDPRPLPLGTPASISFG